jgi:hypothetical protein
MTSYYETFALKMLLSGIIMEPINIPNVSYRVTKSPYVAVKGTKILVLVDKMIQMRAFYNHRSYSLRCQSLYLANSLSGNLLCQSTFYKFHIYLDLS